MAKLKNLGHENRHQNYSTKLCMISLEETLLLAALFTVTQMTIHKVTAKGPLSLGASLELSQNLLGYLM